jgi:hypothetical protein
MRKKNTINTDLIQEVIKDFETRKTARRALELQWQLNIDFLRGNQNNHITKFDTVVPMGKQFYWQEREVYNHLSRMVEARLGKLAMECVKLDMQQVVEKANMWSEMTGTAFYKVIWEDGAKVVVCSPFEIYPDQLTAEDITECRSIIHAKVYRVSEIERIWGVGITGQEVDVFDIGSTNRRKRTTMENAAIVIERYERPSIAFPDGRLVIVAGDKLVFDGPLPYGIPFVRQCCELVAGCFYGKSTVERAIPVQRAYNAVKNRKTEFLNRLACGVLSVEEGSIDLEALENDGLAPGKVLVYRQGTTAPKFVDTGTLPNELEREEERLLRELEAICGVASFQHLSESVNLSGIALQIMVDQESQRMARVVGQITRSVAEVKKQVERLEKQFGELTQS